ncbi:MAG: hypothetical protein IPI64_02655 [Chloracidobacterium sp.]|nr:hypothetical protein [Chloracidobacterium sp.]
MMNRIFIFFATLLLASITCFGQNTGKITGKVTFGGDNSVLHQVSVQIVELRRSTVTDEDGVYI